MRGCRVPALRSLTGIVEGLPRGEGEASGCVLGAGNVGARQAADAVVFPEVCLVEAPHSK